MSDPAELGRKGLPQADLLSAASERRSLCRVGAAAGDRERSSRGLRATSQIDLTFGRRRVQCARCLLCKTERAFARVDLHGKSLAGLDLTQALFIGVDLRDAALIGTNLKWATLAAGTSIDGARLIGANLEGTAAHDLDFTKSIVRYSDFSSAGLERAKFDARALP